MRFRLIAETLTHRAKYAITGLVTALFLIVILSGAIRAIRNPERYGPRRIAGRPRQSRAKGIARAMLETLPIVKFGDLEENKQPAEHAGDVEMNGAVNAEHNGTTETDTEPPQAAAEPSRVNDENIPAVDETAVKEEAA